MFHLQWVEVGYQQGSRTYTPPERAVPGSMSRALVFTRSSTKLTMFTERRHSFHRQPLLVTCILYVHRAVCSPLPHTPTVHLTAPVTLSNKGATKSHRLPPPTTRGTHNGSARGTVHHFGHTHHNATEQATLADVQCWTVCWFAFYKNGSVSHSPKTVVGHKLQGSHYS